jgi:octaheme c-type cytochrome (tetrathionate reductase family)
MRTTTTLLTVALLGAPLSPAGAGEAAKLHADAFAGPYSSGPEVTRACLDCHEQQARDVMKTVHWTWQEPQEVPGRGSVRLGKANLINNFCLAVPSNWPRCTSCHVGYGWKDSSFRFDDPGLVDCLACHDTTGTYSKAPAGAGAPAPGVDLLRVAREVGAPRRAACGSCHFFGGGGDHVKHGDLDSSLAAPTREMDVHMAAEGPNLTCQDCHKTTEHRIAGEALSVSLGRGARVRCTDCHGRTPHRLADINRHVARVACETCHIPTFARTLPTKVWWDWSKAGEDRPPTKDAHGLETYAKIKGEFRWAKDIVAEYRWFSGEVARSLPGDVVDPARVVSLNRPIGSRDDEDARIHPFKVMRGKQPYDKGSGQLAVAHLFGGYWTHFDWTRAIRDGMAAAGLAFSGEHGFVETEMYWKVSHMVVPAQEALRCEACHGTPGRMDWKSLGYERDPASTPPSPSPTSGR